MRPYRHVKRKVVMAQYAYDLCDRDIRFYDDKNVVSESVEFLHSRGAGRFYAGSYFCANYFLEWIRRADILIDVLHEHGFPLTLVLPVFSNRTIGPAREWILQIRESISEVVVNDYGMLIWCHENLDCPIHLGRLFMRQPRDPRYPDLQSSVFPIPFSVQTLEQFQKEYGVTGMEMEGFGRAIDASDLPDGMLLSVHGPWFMMSCDFICEDASAGRPIEKKFRPDIPCNLECTGVHYNYTLVNGQVVKTGRGLYSWQEKAPEYMLPPSSEIRFLEFYPYTEEGTI